MTDGYDKLMGHSKAEWLNNGMTLREWAELERTARQWENQTDD